MFSCRNILFAALAATLLSVFGWSQETDEPESWWLRVRSDEKTFAVRPDGQEKKELTHLPPPLKGKLSPDKTKRVYVSYEDGNAEVYTADADGKNPKRLTNDEAIDNNPDWSPDGKRIVFGSTRTKTWQIYVMDADGGNLKQITDEELGAWRPQFLPDGKMCFLAWRKPQPKGMLVDLIVTNDGKDTKTLVSKTVITEYSWSPNAKMIAYGTPGKVVFHSLENSKSTEVECAKIHKELAGHGPSQIRWSPDSKAVACRLYVLGGRERETKYMGDDELFVIPLEGKTTWFQLDGPNFEWMSSKDVPK